MALNHDFTASVFTKLKERKREKSIEFSMNAVGSKYNINVTDTVPLYNMDAENRFMLMADGGNNTMWGPLVEKAYATFMGSYANIDKKGVASEVMRVLANLPGFIYNTQTTDNIWEQINIAILNGDIVTGRTDGNQG